MKKILSLIFATAVLLALPLHAQTTVTNASGGIGTVTNLIPVSGGWGQAIENGVSFIEGTTNSGVVQIEGGVLYAKSTKAFGGFTDVYLPVGGTNSLFGAGFGIAYLDHNFYDATLNARLGSTYTVPFLKIPLYTYIESGGGLNISKDAAIAQAFAGVTLPIPITSTQTLTVGAAAGTISDYQGTILAFGLSYKWMF